VILVMLAPARSPGCFYAGCPGGCGQIRPETERIWDNCRQWITERRIPFPLFHRWPADSRPAHRWSGRPCGRRSPLRHSSPCPR